MTTQTSGPRWHVPEWTFADRLRKIRRETGLTQSDFSARIEIKEKRYAAWESGTNQPGDIVTIAKRIELAFRVPATWVLGLGPFESGNSGPDGPQGTSTLVRSYRISRAA